MNVLAHNLAMGGWLAAQLQRRTWVEITCDVPGGPIRRVVHVERVTPNAMLNLRRAVASLAPAILREVGAQRDGWAVPA